MRRIQFEPFGDHYCKYDNENIRFLDKGSHYELIFTDDFVTPPSNISRNGFSAISPRISGTSLLTDIIMDWKVS